MKTVHFKQATGKILGYYDKSIHTEIPTPNKEITDEVWQEALNINANHIGEDKVISKKDMRSQAEKVKDEERQAAAQSKKNKDDYRETVLDHLTSTIKEVKNGGIAPTFEEFIYSIP